MAGDLIELFHQTVADALIRQTSSLFGEGAENITSATGAILPVLLGHLIQKSGTPGETRHLISYLKEHHTDGQILTHVNTLLLDPDQTKALLAEGSVHLTYLLGDSQASVVDALSSAHSLRTSSASGLLKLTASLFLHILGKYIGEKSLDAQGVQRLLGQHTDAVQSGWPAGLPAPSGTVTERESATSSIRPDTIAQEDTSTTGRSKYLPWVVLMIASLGLFYLVEKGCGATDKAGNPDPDKTVSPESLPNQPDTLKTDTR